ncbi:hypothetical protein [Actinoplanes sp. NPDC089786]|uniref:hypothetical protein n=1 Tax=Actinoplanes sp. NPDC089786 TaxID=3155185 RepID=UPI003430A36B
MFGARLTEGRLAWARRCRLAEAWTSRLTETWLPQTRCSRLRAGGLAGPRQALRPGLGAARLTPLRGSGLAHRRGAARLVELSSRSLGSLTRLTNRRSIHSRLPRHVLTRTASLARPSQTRTTRLTRPSQTRTTRLTRPSQTRTTRLTRQG